MAHDLFEVRNTRGNIVCVEWNRSKAGFLMPNYSIVYSNDPPSVDDCYGLCPILDEEADLRSGLFENYSDDMLAIDSTIDITGNTYTDSLFRACAESGRPWAFRILSNRGKVFCTLSFADISGLMEFKLRF
jgi:hypothetical protein